MTYEHGTDFERQKTCRKNAKMSGHLQVCFKEIILSQPSFRKTNLHSNQCLFIANSISTQLISGNQETSYMLIKQMLA